MVSLKHCNTQSRISLEIIKQCSLNMAPEMYFAEQNDTSRAVAITAVPLLLFLVKTKIPRFDLKQGSPPPNNLMGKDGNQELSVPL